MPTEAPGPRRPRNFQQLLTEFGPAALGTYLVLYAGVLVAYFVVALWWRPQGEGGLLALFVGAWVAAKATQLPRVAATAVLAPLVARYLGRASTKPPA
jgi:hypothetical protein